MVLLKIKCVQIAWKKYKTYGTHCMVVYFYELKLTHLPLFLSEERKLMDDFFHIIYLI